MKTHIWLYDCVLPRMSSPCHLHFYTICHEIKKNEIQAVFDLILITLKQYTIFKYSLFLILQRSLEKYERYFY
jgi:hypothetical protein